MARKAKGKRDDGRFQVKLTVGKNADGSVSIKYFYSRVSKADAERQKREYMQSHTFGEVAAPEPPPEMTLQEWCKAWAASYKGGLSDNTQDNYRYSYTHFCNYIYNNTRFGDMPLSEFKPVHLANYVTSLSGTSEGNIDAKRGVVREIFEVALDNGLVATNPARKLPKVSGTYSGHKAIERSTIDFITKNYRFHRAGLVFMIMMWAGLRRGEALALQWEDVDMARNMIHVSRSLDIKHKKEKDPKTKKGFRDVPIFAPLMRALQIAKQEAGENAVGLICKSASGEAYTESAFVRALNGFLLCMERVLNGAEHPENNQGFRRDIAMKKAEESGKEWQTVSFTPHDLRVTFCTMCYDAGVDVQTAKEWMGHSDIRITLGIYTKLSKERKGASTESMDTFAKSFSTAPDLALINGK